MKKYLKAIQEWKNASIVEEVEQSRHIDLDGFKIHDSLEENVWTEQKKLEPHIRRRLLNIAKQFWEGIDLPTVPVEDVTFTGSLANYNWSSYSDVDLHILVDYSNLPADDEILQALMNSKRAAWNNKHNIEIYLSLIHI